MLNISPTLQKAYKVRRGHLHFRRSKGQEAAHLDTGRVKPLDAPFGPTEPDSHLTRKRQESWGLEKLLKKFQTHIHPAQSLG